MGVQWLVGRVCVKTKNQRKRWPALVFCCLLCLSAGGVLSDNLHKCGGLAKDQGGKAKGNGDSGNGRGGVEMSSYAGRPAGGFAASYFQHCGAWAVWCACWRHGLGGGVECCADCCGVRCQAGGVAFERLAGVVHGVELCKESARGFVCLVARAVPLVAVE